VLLLFFPGVVVLAFLLAGPLRRFVPSLPGSLLGFVIGTTGIALSFGTREPRTDVTTM
jgi:hypothetical protein